MADGSIMQFDDIKIIGVVGAGQMGRGIAQVCATAGYHVLLVDVAEPLLAGAVSKIRASLDRAIERGVQCQTEEVLARIQPVVQMDRLRDAQLVIEAIPEDLARKQAIFGELNRHCQPHAILASNTSSISITKLGAASARPDRVLGVHFMNPVPVMRLVEIVQGPETSQHTLQMAMELSRRLGKVPVVAKDVPGFIVNRVLMPMINEAMFALEEGVASAEDIDLAMTTGANHPVGPLALADRIGLDTVLAICEVLYQDLGDPKFVRAHCCAATSRPAGWDEKPDTDSISTKQAARARRPPAIRCPLAEDGSCKNAKSLSLTLRTRDQRVYTARRSEGLVAGEDLRPPGSFPYTRGVYPTMYRGRLWTMRQFAGFGSADDTNRRFKYLLEHGQTGLSVAFDHADTDGDRCG